MNQHPSLSTVSSVVTLGARLLLGGLMSYAAVMKMSDPQQFAFAIKGFQIIPETAGEPLIVLLAFVTPWTELLAGLGLIFGFWTRASSLVIGALLIAFIGGLLNVIFDILAEDISASCSCFGDINFICGAEVGWCQVIRNIVLLGLTAVCFTLGGGLFSLDGLFGIAKESIRGPALGLGQGAEEADAAALDSGE